MTLASKASFVIERNLDGELTLESVATACGVSRFHLAHAFVSATGRSVMEHVRARRLTEAARALSQGSPNILDVALAAGYSSHEAFTRAFRVHFETTPEELRKRGCLDGLNLAEIFIMSKQQQVQLAAPRIKSVGLQQFVGLAVPRGLGDAPKIPAQWREFMSGPYQRIANKLEGAPVGITLPAESDDEFLYVCAAPVLGFDATPKGLSEFTLEPTEYAVFAHDRHVSELPATYAAIWNDWLPSSGRAPKKAASLEHHNPAFDPRTGEGGVTVWIPLA